MPLCGTRLRPPLFFCLVKRKVAAAAVEKKSAINQTCTPCKFGKTGSVRTAVQMKQCVLNHGRGTHLAAVLYSDQTLKYTGIYDITHEVDRVGTGDAFVGGMIYGLLTYPDNDQKALEFALAASALKNTVYGDFNQVTVEEVESLMKGNTSGRVTR